MNKIAIFFLAFYASLSTGSASGNSPDRPNNYPDINPGNNTQYEYQAYVELTSEENKSHTGV